MNQEHDGLESGRRAVPKTGSPVADVNRRSKIGRMKPSFRRKLQLSDAIDFLCSRGGASPEAHLVLECVRANNFDQSKKPQSHMERSTFQPSSTFTNNRLLHLYSKTGNLRDAHDLFDKMPHRDIISWNALLSAYSKSASVEDFMALFNRMPLHDSVSYNTVISGLAGNGYSTKALMFFIRMQRDGFVPAEYAYVSALRSCSQLLDVKHGKQIHGRIVAGNLIGNPFVCNALTGLYANCREIDKAGRVFHGMTNKNVVSWNSMISGYLKNGQPLKCINLFHRMHLSGFMPDQVTVSNILGAYLQNGNFNAARNLFKEFKEKDLICWTTMIAGCTQNGKEEYALMTFQEMQLENTRPDSFIMSSLISSCAKLASLNHGQAIHGKAVLMGVDADLLVSTALIDMYSKCGETSDAFFVFKMMPTRNVVSWNSIIVGCAQNGRDPEALSLYEEMLRQCFKPDVVTFVGILSACIHGGLIDRGQKYFDSISKIHKMTPTSDHYACMIHLFGHAGYMDRALVLIKTLPHEPDHLIWSTLLSICAINGDVEHGEMAAKHLFELDPLGAGPYIVLSNMYATCGRWKDVAQTRSLMKGNGVKKLAAYSWVELDNEVHKFVAGDQTHPETRQFYKELERLMGKLQKVGFLPNTDVVLHDVGEDEKLKSILHHSEKLALAFVLMRKPDGRMPIRIMKNIRVCGDCHTFMKFVSRVINRSIKLRDSNRFHHFVGGQCCCKDYW